MQESGLKQTSNTFEAEIELIIYLTKGAKQVLKGQESESSDNMSEINITQSSIEKQTPPLTSTEPEKSEGKVGTAPHLAAIITM